MALRLPLITSDEVKALTETMSLMGYDSLLLHAPMLYFAMGKEWEGSIPVSYTHLTLPTKA